MKIRFETKIESKLRFHTKMKSDPTIKFPTKICMHSNFKFILVHESI